MSNIIQLRRKSFTYRSKGKKSIGDEPEAQELLLLLAENPCTPETLFGIIQKAFKGQDDQHGQARMKPDNASMDGPQERHGCPGPQGGAPAQGIPRKSPEKGPG